MFWYCAETSCRALSMGSSVAEGESLYWSAMPLEPHTPRSITPPERWALFRICTATVERSCVPEGARDGDGEEPVAGLGCAEVCGVGLEQAEIANSMETAAASKCFSKENGLRIIRIIRMVRILGT